MLKHDCSPPRQERDSVSPGSRKSSPKATRCSSTCRSRSTAAGNDFESGYGCAGSHGESKSYERDPTFVRRAGAARLGFESVRLVELPDEPQPFEGQKWVDLVDSFCVRDDQIGKASCRDDRCLGRSELGADPADDRIDLAGEAEDEA